jgi:hypothetical protein
MPIVATPEVGIPLPFDTTPEELNDFRDKAHALFETVQELIAQGAEVEITDEDKRQSHAIFSSQKIPPAKQLTPGTIINLEAGVGLFSDRIDINVTHRTVQDIERDLVKTLEMYMGPVETVEATEMKSLKDINLDEEDGSGPTS